MLQVIKVISFYFKNFVCYANSFHASYKSISQFSAYIYIYIYIKVKYHKLRTKYMIFFKKI